MSKFIVTNFFRQKSDERFRVDAKESGEEELRVRRALVKQNTRINTSIEEEEEKEDDNDGKNCTTFSASCLFSNANYVRTPVVLYSSLKSFLFA